MRYNHSIVLIKLLFTVLHRPTLSYSTKIFYPTQRRSIHHYLIPIMTSTIDISIIPSTKQIPLPNPSKSAFDVFGKGLQSSLSKEYSEMLDEIIQSDQKKDSLYAMSRAVLKNTGKVMFDLRTGESNDVKNLLDSSEQLVIEMVEVMGGNNQPRDGRFTQTIERYAEVKMFYYFFSHGVLAPPSVMKPCNDEEYIGATLGFAKELTRYVVGRASENDVTSIKICYSLINQLNGKMLEFDFRNGHLRRKYDGLKYTLKTIEEIMFELSLIHSSTSIVKPIPFVVENSSSEGESLAPLKKIRVEDEKENIEDVDRISIDEINAIRDRMDSYDKEREKIIKLSRDVQKLSKQSIYSIHRGNYIEANQKIEASKTIIIQLTDQIIKPYPGLRAGSFAGCLEEWVEGILLLEWSRNSKILLKSELGEFVTISEYIGALSDFTGEIGRMAVLFASQRKVDAVKAILQADLIISSYISQFNISGSYTKKLNAVNMNFKKVEDILYQLKLQQMGGKALQRDPEPLLTEDGVGSGGGVENGVNTEE